MKGVVAVDRCTAFVLSLVVLVASVAFVAADDDTVTWAGMTLRALSDLELDVVEQAYGEPCGLYVKAVADNSLAAKTGVVAGDVLISVRMPNETDYYPIPGDIEEMADFCGETQPNDKIRLLILRKQDGEWTQIKCQLGKPMGTAVAEGLLEGDETQLQSYVAGSGGFSFASKEPGAVLAKAADGSPLTQGDVDIYGSLVAWAFNTRLTEGQKVTVREALMEFWPAAQSQDVQNFAGGVRSMPDLIPKLSAEQREQMRLNLATTLLGMAQNMPGHPMSRVIMAVSGAMRQVLAGAGTDAEFTQQDVNAMIEMMMFQQQQTSGQPVSITAEQYQQLVQQLVARYNQAPAEEKMALANMDAQWGMLRAAWARAQAAQQQALAQQWQQAYAQQQATTGYSPYMTGWQGAAPAGGGQMSQGSFDAVMNAMNATHDASMQTLGAIDGGYDTSVYDSGGDWLYDY